MITQLDPMPSTTIPDRPLAERVEDRALSVAYVVHTFHMGGLERCVARLVNHLDPLRFRPTIICLNRNGDAAGWIDRADVPIVELRKAAGNDPRVVWRLARELRSQRIDLVHSHNWGTLLETVLARKMARVPMHVHAEHGLELADLQQTGWKRQARRGITRWALRQADLVVAVSDSVRQRIEQRCGYPAQRVELIPNGVEKPPCDPSGADRDRLRASLGIDEQAIVLGTIGRLAPVKALDMAIDVVALLAQQNNDVHLIIIGDGCDRPLLTQHADRQGVADRVHFAGPQQHVGPWLSVFDIYVNSSISEGMNLAILEAMAAGVPCIVTDVGANAQLVNGMDACGHVVPSGDREAMAAAIVSVRQNSQQAQQMSCNALQRHRAHYSTNAMVRNYEMAYANAAARGRGERQVSR